MNTVNIELSWLIYAVMTLFLIFMLIKQKLTSNKIKKLEMNGRPLASDKVYGEQKIYKHKDGLNVINGTKHYYKNDQLHRLDGPAIEYANGDKYWHKDGMLHREYGPAVERVNGDKEWYIEGTRHRIDGPAIEHKSGKWWYLDGKQIVDPIKNISFLEKERDLKLKTNKFDKSNLNFFNSFLKISENDYINLMAVYDVSIVKVDNLKDCHKGFEFEVSIKAYPNKTIVLQGNYAKSFIESYLSETI